MPVLQGLAEKIRCPVIVGNGRIPLLQSPATYGNGTQDEPRPENTGRRPEDVATCHQNLRSFGLGCFKATRTVPVLGHFVKLDKGVGLGCLAPVLLQVSKLDGTSRTENNPKSPEN